MTSSIRIAIPVPTSRDQVYNQRCWPDYAAAVTACGGEPVELSLGVSDAEVRRLSAGCDGILLPGSPADVDPGRYGQQAIAACAPADVVREAVDLCLLEDAYQRGKPLLCICFGAQMLNVWRGGTLLQDLAYVPVNHTAGPAVKVAHTISVSANSRLGLVARVSMKRAGAPMAEDAQGFFRIPVNSSHHQAIGIPGDGLRIAGRCPQDGVVEAIEGGDVDHFVVGVQWHPERGFADNAVSGELFRRFLRAAAQTE